MSGSYENEEFERLHPYPVYPFKPFGFGSLSLYDQRMSMRMADPLDAYRPLSEQTSNAPYWDAFK